MDVVASPPMITHSQICTTITNKPILIMESLNLENVYFFYFLIYIIDYDYHIIFLIEKFGI